MAGKTGIGIIGCGAIGQFHVAAFSKCASARIVGVCDRDLKRALFTARKTKAPQWTTDYRKLLVSPCVEAVVVGTPNSTHRQIVIDSLEAGKHVLCEKPLAMNHAQAATMAQAAKKARKVLMVGFTHRFRADSRALRVLILKGKLGRIYHIKAFAERRRGVPGKGGWFTTKKLSGGGPLIDIGVHIVDLALWLAGFPQVASVSGATYAELAGGRDYVQKGGWGTPVKGGTCDVEDFATALIKFKNGATLLLETSWAVNQEKDTFYIELLGNKAGAKLDWGQPVRIFAQKGHQLGEKTHSPTARDPYAEEASHFLSCVRTGKRPICSAEEGVIVQKILDSIYLSSSTGKEIRF